MMVSNRGSVLRLLVWQWKAVTVFTASAAAIAYYHLYIDASARLPALPLAVVGGALGIFVSFRTNSAYGRWWEGRQLWGRLVNVSRTFASQVLAYFPKDGDGRELAVALVRRHIAYVHTLRVVLRVQNLTADADVQLFLTSDERTTLPGETNANHALVHANLEGVALAHRRGWINDMQLFALDESLRIVLDVQGGCERIKKTPLPRGYAFIAERLIMAFGMLFPLAAVAELGWFVIPVSVLVCLSFTLISEAGRVLEDPFSTFWNGLPLMALSRTIEVNLRQRMGESAAELPKVPVPDNRGILM